MIPRVFDIAREPQQVLSAIDGYQNGPLLPLEIAIKPLIPFFEEGTLERNVWIVKERCQNPSDNLTVNESASIMLYTFNWDTNEKSLYYLLNETLRMEKRDKLRPWFSYLKLFLTALNRLPRINDTIFRGVKLDISSQYILGKRQFWWGLSSCTDSMDVLQSEQYCGKDGPRTIFFIKCTSGRSIKRHSFYSVEEEILLMPGFYFEIHSSNDLGNGLHFIRLHEKVSPHVMLALPEKPGIFIEGICRNTECSLYDKDIRISFGCCCLDVLVGLDEKNCMCPLCFEYTEPLKFGFIHCSWRWSGRKKDKPSTPPVNCSNDWINTDVPTYFQSNNDNDSTTTWLKLVIEAREISS
ncbi:unnamed protein product [Rotaria socialis]|uniref:NAD(P)(+)--arginine ADP-ribosyltransferase n=1 Tax=Rotaria socialis TaxID=392032 RepID=A0A820IJ52_9BILA|nr:unnamed protein product [Rotaria socialis]CAF4309593.1 unnamed protein product [Rotaria socialis]